MATPSTSTTLKRIRTVNAVLCVLGILISCYAYRVETRKGTRQKLPSDVRYQPAHELFQGVYIKVWKRIRVIGPHRWIEITVYNSTQQRLWCALLPLRPRVWCTGRKNSWRNYISCSASYLTLGLCIWRVSCIFVLHDFLRRVRHHVCDQRPAADLQRAAPQARFCTASQGKTQLMTFPRSARFRPEHEEFFLILFL
uniref:Putative secreted protein n=1 Tax=Ixodes ricinus TaxID=34613 RepID=V5H1Q5_IXORI